MSCSRSGVFHFGFVQHGNRDINNNKKAYLKRGRGMCVCVCVYGEGETEGMGCILVPEGRSL